VRLPGAYFAPTKGYGPFVQHCERETPNGHHPATPETTGTAGRQPRHPVSYHPAGWATHGHSVHAGKLAPTTNPACTGPRNTVGVACRARRQEYSSQPCVKTVNAKPFQSRFRFPAHHSPIAHAMRVQVQPDYADTQ